MDSYTRVNGLHRFVNDCVSRNSCRINTSTETNQMILVSFFSEDNVLSDEIKRALHDVHIFEYQSKENLAFKKSRLSTICNIVT